MRTVICNELRGICVYRIESYNYQGYCVDTSIDDIRQKTDIGRPSES